MYTESGLLTTTLRLVEKKLNLPTTIRQIILKLVSGNYIVIWAALYDGRDVSGGHRYKSYKGQVTNLWNNAVERYKKGVQVRIDSKRVANGWADGVWSPDTK